MDNSPRFVINRKSLVNYCAAKLSLVGEIIHPLLFSTFPILSLYANNISELVPVDIRRSLLIMYISLFIGLFVLFRIMKDWRKASLMSTVGSVLFFSYGHLYQVLKNIVILDHPVGRHRYLILLVLMLALWWFWWVNRKSASFPGIHKLLNSVGLVLILFPMVQMIGSSQNKELNPARGNLQEITPLPTNLEHKKPDIYYIILDGYARQDVLHDLYSFDNSGMIEWLKNLGFVIPDMSYSNYMQTLLSLGSSLNMDYLNQFEGWQDENRNELNVFTPLIRSSQVRNELAQLGYATIAFETGYRPTNIRDADIFLSVEQNEYLGSRIVLRVNEFEDILIKSTLLGVLYDPAIMNQISADLILEDPYASHRNRVHYTFSELAEIPTWEGDFFVFAHVISPHPPFIFDAQGGSLTPSGAFTLYDASDYPGTSSEYVRLYREQVTYLNSLIMSTIKAILDRSEPVPIIIIQADHGPGAFLQTDSMQDSDLKERMAIFQALLLPGVLEESISPSHSPVNTFRVILNSYFDFTRPLLPDRSYFATWRRPFDFTDVTELLPK